MMCDKQNKKRDEWLKFLKTSFNDVAKKVKLNMCELNIVKEMIKNIGKYFNKEQNFWTNHQVIGIREVFGGILVKKLGSVAS